MMQPEEQLFNWSDYVIADIRADTANGSKVPHTGPPERFQKRGFVGGLLSEKIPFSWQMMARVGQNFDDLQP